MPDLSGKTVAIIMANEGVEQIELTRPREQLVNAGAEVHLIAPKSEKIRAFNHLEAADAFEPDYTTAQLDVERYDGVVLPGGVANPDQLRMDEPTLDFLRTYLASGKPLSVICHGPWTLVEAGVVQGRTLTSYPSLQTDIRNAGGTWVDKEVVADNGLVSSRHPGDLDAFCSKMLEEFAEGRHTRAA